MKRILMILIAMISLASAMDLYVPVDDDVYDYLERQATSGFIPSFKNDIKPITRDVVAYWLVELKDVQDQMHRVDKQLLHSYLSDYRHELTDEKHPSLGKNRKSNFGLSTWKNFDRDMNNIVTQDIWDEEQHIFVMEDEKSTVWVNTDFTIRGEGKDASVRSFDMVGAEVAMQLGENLAFYADTYFYHQLRSGNYLEPATELVNYPYSEGNTFNSLWNSKSYVNLSGNFGTLSLSYYPLIWGNARNSILLSEIAPPFASITYSKEFKALKYQFLYGSLMSDQFTYTTAGRTYLPKYIVGHHMEIHLHPQFHINVAEMMIYGNRPAELTYMVPLLMLWPTETVLGNRDNKMLSVGGELIAFEGIRLYGNLMVDDLWLSKLSEDYWKNRLALQGGVQWSPRYFPMDVNVEFTAVRPWTYAHAYPTSSHTHNGSDLGFKFGPNSQVLSGGITYDISAKHKLTFSFDHVLLGADSIDVAGTMYPSGGNSNQDYSFRSEDMDQATQWLMGDLSMKDMLRLEWKYRWRKQIEFKTACELQIIDDQPSMFYSLQVNFRY